MFTWTNFIQHAQLQTKSQTRKAENVCQLLLLNDR
jgi:hypothetical protein